MWLPNSPVRNKGHQFVVSFSLLPGSPVQLRPNRPWANAVDPDFERRHFLRNALHQEHEPAFRCCIVNATGPGNDLMHRTHKYNFPGGCGDRFDDPASFEFPDSFSGTQKLTSQVRTDHQVPLLLSHSVNRRIILNTRIVDEDINGSLLFNGLLEHHLNLVFP